MPSWRLPCWQMESLGPIPLAPGSLLKEVAFFALPLFLSPSFLPHFGGKPAIFIAKSDRAGKQANEEVEREEATQRGANSQKEHKAIPIHNATYSGR